MQGVWSSKSRSLEIPISIPGKPDAFGAQASKDSITRTAALQESMQPQLAPTPRVMPLFRNCPGQPLVLARYQTLHAPCPVLGGECNRLAWATRTGLQALAVVAPLARRQRNRQSGRDFLEIEICRDSVDFDVVLLRVFIIVKWLQDCISLR